MTRQRKIDRNLLFAFLSVPLLSSIMSAIHLINMVELGNPFFMAVVLAVTFELGSIVSFVALSKNILQRLKKDILYLIFGMLFVLQAFGNVYSSFDYIRVMLIADPTWLDSFREMFFNAIDVSTSKLMLSCIIGLPIPIISLAFLKSAIDYFSFDGDDAARAEVEDSPTKGLGDSKPVEEPVVEKKTEVSPKVSQAAPIGFIPYVDYVYVGENKESLDTSVFKSPGISTIEPPQIEVTDEPVVENEHVSQQVEEISPGEPEQAQIDEQSAPVEEPAEEISSEEPEQSKIEEQPVQNEPAVVAEPEKQEAPAQVIPVQAQSDQSEKKSS